MDDNAGFLARSELQRLFDVLSRRGYVCVGPAVKEGAVQFAELNGAGQLRTGWRDEQDPGRQRLHEGHDDRCLAWASAGGESRPDPEIP